MRTTALAAAAAALALAGTALADTQQYAGALDASDPTWNRPLEGFGGMSGVGVGVRYEVMPLWVSVAGTYTFNSVQTGFDGFLFLYSDPFNPANGLVNGVASNDDGTGGIGTSDFTAALGANTQYWIVMTAFAPDDHTGTYINTVSGIGSVNFSEVPAPAAAALLGLGGLVGARRRRA